VTKKGNTNAFKHGIYSKFVAVVDDADQIEKMPINSNKEELANARAKLAQSLKKYNDAPNDEERLKWDYSCRHWTEIILAHTTHNANRRESEVSVFQSLLDAVRSANDRQNVQK
jgi:hypothetical protein